MSERHFCYFGNVNHIITNIEYQNPMEVYQRKCIHQSCGQYLEFYIDTYLGYFFLTMLKIRLNYDFNYLM